MSRAQLDAFGFSPSSVANAVRTGRLEWLSERVLRVVGSPDTPDQRAMAAALDVPGGAVARFSAAALWEMPGFLLEPVHVLTTRRPHRDRAHIGRMHTSTRFACTERTFVRGIPVTTPLRTLHDLSGCIHFDRLDLLCDRMLSKRLLRLDALLVSISSLPTRGGAPGSRSMRRLARKRGGDYEPPESSLERRFETIIGDAGDPQFERQVDLGDDDGWIGRVDYLDRLRCVVVEIQGAFFHTGGALAEHDRARAKRLGRAGWVVLQISEFEVWHRPDLVLSRVRSARSLAARRKDQGGSPHPADSTT